MSTRLCGPCDSSLRKALERVGLTPFIGTEHDPYEWSKNWIVTHAKMFFQNHPDGQFDPEARCACCLIEKHHPPRDPQARRPFIHGTADEALFQFRQRGWL